MLSFYNFLTNDYIQVYATKLRCIITNLSEIIHKKKIPRFSILDIL